MWAALDAVTANGGGQRCECCGIRRKRWRAWNKRDKRTRWHNAYQDGEGVFIEGRAPRCGALAWLDAPAFDGRPGILPVYDGPDEIPF